VAGPGGNRWDDVFTDPVAPDFAIGGKGKDPRTAAVEADSAEV
jgi:hypothetical protein